MGSESCMGRVVLEAIIFRGGRLGFSLHVLR